MLAMGIPIDSPGINGLHEVPHLCIVKFHGVGGMPRNYGTKCMRMFPQPKLTNAVWGAGLSFAKCHAEKKVCASQYRHSPCMESSLTEHTTSIIIILILSINYVYRYRMTLTRREYLTARNGQEPLDTGPGATIFTRPIECTYHTTTRDHRLT